MFKLNLFKGYMSCGVLDVSFKDRGGVFCHYSKPRGGLGYFSKPFAWIGFLKPFPPLFFFFANTHPVENPSRTSTLPAIVAAIPALPASVPTNSSCQPSSPTTSLFPALLLCCFLHLRRSFSCVGDHHCTFRRPPSLSQHLVSFPFRCSNEPQATPAAVAFSVGVTTAGKEEGSPSSVNLHCVGEYSGSRSLSAIANSCFGRSICMYT